MPAAPAYSRPAQTRLPPSPSFSVSLQLCVKGVVLGRGAVIAPLDDAPGARGGLALEGRQDQIQALLSAAYGHVVDLRVLRSLDAASDALRSGEPALAAIYLAQADLPLLPDIEAANTLERVAASLAQGELPTLLLKRVAERRESGRRRATLRKFNPYHDDRGRFATADGAPVSTVSDTDAGAKEKRADEVRQKITDTALQNLKQNPDLWQDEVARGNFPAGTDKCNLFVYETLAAAGADPRRPHHSTLNTLTGGNFGRTYPPTAGDWANPSYDIPGWRVLNEGEKPETGDVVAQRISYDHATGHVMIVGPDDTFIGTGEPNGKPVGTLEQVHATDYLGETYSGGGRDPHGPIVFRRYSGK
jgi:hypothetical protein